VSAPEASGLLQNNEPVVVVEVGSTARAYPIQILIWHEIANDLPGETPIAVTFCPLCNTAIAFDRRVDGVGAVRFGTTGNLRHSDLVMWTDDPGETWWQELTGEAIVGTLAGTRLAPVTAQVIAFADFKAAYPAGQMLSRETGTDTARTWWRHGGGLLVGLADARAAAGLTKTQLAIRSGVPRETISRLENLRRPAWLSTTRLLATALDLSPEALIAARLRP
jgi:DNA-binding XRE family transcriptional regulator